MGLLVVALHIQIVYNTESMTVGIFTTPIQEQQLVRIQKKGQVTLPTKVRRKLNLKKGDLVSVSETSSGVLITPSEVLAVKTLDRIGEELKKQGLSLEELIEAGRDERTPLLEQVYGIRTDKNKKG
jgi:AbrB family looped-hinge helix DNA binding protein